DYYGIGLVLGGGEVSLMELIRAYLCMAQGGIYHQPNFILELNGISQKSQPSTFRISSPQYNYLITNILSDHHARTSEFGFNSILNLPFGCAVKTGTSHRFCDNWTVGFTTAYTLGVWVGNFDHTPMMKVSGVTGAGPLFASIMYQLAQSKSFPENFPVPDGLLEVPVCPLSGKKPNPSCPSVIMELMTQSDEAGYNQDVCQMHIPEVSEVRTVIPPEFRPWAEKVHVEVKPAGLEPELRIIHPRNGAVYYRMSNLAPRFQSVRMEAILRNMKENVNWYLNNKLIHTTSAEHNFLWMAEPGKYQLKAVSEKKTNLVDEIGFEVK
ncbi:MAG: penicillin-binding protein 1C, partial [Calditrichaeota bacterium]